MRTLAGSGVPDPAKPRSCPKSPDQGFTVIELLVCIGVIAVLLILAVPAYTSLQTTNRNTRCISNLRSAGALLLSYGMESGQQFRFFARGGNDSGQPIWGKALEDKGYLGNRKLLRCPAGKSERLITDSAWYWNTYGLNMADADGKPTIAAGNAQVYTLRLLAVANPARQALLVDSGTLAEFQPGLRSETYRVNIQKLTDGVQLRHKNKANVIFMDGHLEALSRTELEQYFISTCIYDDNKTF